jgi:hypothetical protein
MDLIDQLRQALPTVFLGSKLDQLTGHAIAWGTVQNKRSRREIPNENEIFKRSGNRLVVARDPFLDWWGSTLSQARRPPVLPPRQPPRRQRRAKATAAGEGLTPPLRRIVQQQGEEEVEL